MEKVGRLELVYETEKISIFSPKFDDETLNDIVQQLRKIEHAIFIESRYARCDYEDHDAIKEIIENLII